MNRLFGLTKETLLALMLALIVGVIALPGQFKMLWVCILIGFAASKQRRYIQSIFGDGRKA